MPRPSCETSVALPWTSSRAWPISPPNASTIAWWPRQTPSVGVVGASRRTISRVAPGLLRPSRPGRDDEVRRAQPLGLVGVDRVVPPDDHLGAELLEQVDEVVGERVVVVDEQDHRSARVIAARARPASAGTPRARRPGPSRRRSRRRPADARRRRGARSSGSRCRCPGRRPAARSRRRPRTGRAGSPRARR